MHILKFFVFHTKYKDKTPKKGCSQSQKFEVRGTSGGGGAGGTRGGGGGGGTSAGPCLNARLPSSSCFRRSLTSMAKGRGPKPGSESPNKGPNSEPAMNENAIHHLKRHALSPLDSASELIAPALGGLTRPRNGPAWTRLHIACAHCMPCHVHALTYTN